MKKKISVTLFLVLFLSCAKLDGVIGTLKSASVPTEQETSQALIQSLVLGMSKGADIVSKADGFYKNPLIAIAFPPEAEKIKSTLVSVGAGNLVEQTTLSFNRAAERASGVAKDVLVRAIQQMTISDAMTILFGPENAATNYLKQNTTQTLTLQFKPIIAESLDAVYATKYWAEVTSKYNQYNYAGLLGKPINTDLAQYVTAKALDGLFLMIEDEEKNIRKNPFKRTTELLKKVFGYADSQKVVTSSKST